MEKRNGDSRSGDTTVVITSCGRQDLLEKTIDSFLEFNTYGGIREYIITEDCGDVTANRKLKEKYASLPIVWIEEPVKRGQIACIDDAYSCVRTPYILHLEDDWEFLAKGFIERSKVILERDPTILQVWLRGETETWGHPLEDGIVEIPGDGAPIRCRRVVKNFRDVWSGFSFSPGLRRLSDYELLGNYRAYGHEEALSIEYESRGYSAVLLLRDDNGPGYVRHAGEERHVRDYGRLPQGLKKAFSSNAFDFYVGSLINLLKPQSLCDIGAGAGKLGRFARQQEKKGNFRCRLTGVEIVSDYVEEFKLSEVYDEVIVADAITLLDRPDIQFDLVIFGESIEYMRKSHGLDLINFLMHRSGYICVTFPDAPGENGKDKHHNERWMAGARMSTWTAEDLKAWDPLCKSQEGMQLLLIKGYQPSHMIVTG